MWYVIQQKFPAHGFEPEGPVEINKVPLCCDPDRLLAVATEGLFQTGFHYFSPQPFSAMRGGRHKAPDRKLVKFRALRHDASIGDHLTLLLFPDMNAQLIKIIIVNERATLLHNEDLLPQFQHGIQLLFGKFFPGFNMKHA